MLKEGIREIGIPRLLIAVFLVIPLSAVLWLILMFKAYQGEEFKLPLVGQMAADRI